MSKSNDKQLHKVCRTCLTSSESTKSLYEACSSTLECLADILMSFTALKCYANDGLPAQICDQCTSELNRFQEFHSKCLESDEILRNPVNIVKIEEINNFEEPEDPLLTLTELEQDKFNLISNTENGSKMETDDDSNSITDSKSLTKPLSSKEIQKELKKNIDLIKHEINITTVKAEIDENQLENEDDSRIRNEQLIGTHSGKRLFACTICDSAFKLKSSLNIHMQRHSCEKLYSCTVCNRNYRRISILKAHMRTHTEEKPYSCTVCDCCFHHNISLTTHMLKHNRQ